MSLHDKIMDLPVCGYSARLVHGNAITAENLTAKPFEKQSTTNGARHEPLPR